MLKHIYKKLFSVFATRLSARTQPGQNSLNYDKDEGGNGKRRKKSYPLHLHISLVYIFLIVILLSIIGVFNYREAKKNVLSATSQVFIQLNNKLKGRMQRLQEIATGAIAYLYDSPAIESRDFASKMKLAPLMGAILQLHPRLGSVALGYADGSFFRFGRVRGIGEQNADPQKAGESQFLIRSYDGVKETQEFIYLDHHFDIVAQYEVPYDGYDPRSREWYRQAIATDKVISTKPYFFYASKGLGKSVAQKSKSGDMVISISFPLAGIDQFFDSFKPTSSSSILIFDSEDNVLYYSGVDIAINKTESGDDKVFLMSDIDYPLYQNIKDKVADASFGIPFTVRLNGKDIFFAVSRLMDDSVGGMNYYVAISAPAADIFPDAADLIRRQGMFTLLALLIAVPTSWFFSRRLSGDLVKLSVVAQDARNFSFSFKEPVHSSVAEFNELSRSIFYTNRTLKRFLDINTAISLERDYAKLLNTVLYETMGTVGAVAGILYLLSSDKTRLTPSAGNCTAAAGASEGEGVSGPSFLASLPHVEKIGEGMSFYLSETIKGTPQIRQHAREDWPSEYMRRMFSAPQMQLVSVPLVYNQNVTGVLCLYRPSESGEPRRSMLSFISQLSGGAAVAIENHRLIGEQKRLFDSFIRLVAESIDSKSHYTGAHCQRVPIIAKILATAVNDAREGPFAGYHLNADSWETLRLASWLHDCGKIITPEHVVDKATKLEAVYDRIHEVRMRFEVLKRDAEISCYRSILQGEDEQDATNELCAQLKRIGDDFAFLAKCNVGDEVMAPEHIRRLQDIAKYTWQRTLSDRLGISEAESKRKEACPEQNLPVTEHVIADKPEHLIKADAPAQDFFGEETDFTLFAPEYKYNLGEVTNLSISRGTLTEEERYLVNSHVLQTIRMLSHLPFPEQHEDIVEIAGSHHERVDARGYPRGIGKESMRVEARIIAIADVFEALTATDRPYKKAKTLSQALDIMSHMSRNGHLDPDLFALFIRSGTYRQYATSHLEKFQLDEVDEDKLLS